MTLDLKAGSGEDREARRQSQASQGAAMNAVKSLVQMPDIAVVGTSLCNTVRD